VSSIIHQFQVKKKNIHVIPDAIKHFPCRKTAGVERRMNLAIFACFQQCKKKIRLRQRFTTGKGYPSEGFVMENRVFFDFIQHLVYGQFPSCHFACLRQTGIRAASARHTPIRVSEKAWFLATDGIFRTYRNTFHAADAPAYGIELFPGNKLALGIVAPPAGQRTSFHKNSCPDSRTIMDGKFFYIEDDSAFHTQHDT
jgi:hypothetical protein